MCQVCFWPVSFIEIMKMDLVLFLEAGFQKQHYF
jgi:hypothetical protein